MSNGFQRVLDHIRSIVESEAEKGRLFERLMKTYFTLDPISIRIVSPTFGYGLNGLLQDPNSMVQTLELI